MFILYFIHDSTLTTLQAFSAVGVGTIIGLIIMYFILKTK